VFPGGASAFAAPVRFGAGVSGPALAIDDFNGDGLPDVLVATQDARLLWLPAQCPPQQPASVVLVNAFDTTASLAGFPRTIHWTRTSSVPWVRVELSRDDGAHWSTLADHVLADHW